MTTQHCREPLERFCAKWNLIPDGELISTHASCLMPSLRDGLPVMLKTSDEVDELRGFALLEWWNGAGAIPVLQREPNAVLMERATGSDSLVHMSEIGHDREAIEIICDVLEKLHNARRGKPPELVPLSRWFTSLFQSESTGYLIRRGQPLARELPASDESSFVLHGDTHHGNVVQSSSGGWYAIDPQGLYGSRAFDYANIFRNPNLDIAADPARFRARLDVVAARANIDRQELLQWIIALCALSHSWGENTALPAGTDRMIGELALAHLDESGRES